jgi:hypothetical protein
MATVEITTRVVKTVYWYIFKYARNLVSKSWLNNKPLSKLYINGKLHKVIAFNDVADKLHK